METASRVLSRLAVHALLTPGHRPDHHAAMVHAFVRADDLQDDPADNQRCGDDHQK